MFVWAGMESFCSVWLSQAPVSGSLGEEPWEVGGMNNEGQSPVTWQACARKPCHLHIGACSFPWEICADLQGRTGRLSINAGRCGQCHGAGDNDSEVLPTLNKWKPNVQQEQAGLSYNFWWNHLTRGPGSGEEKLNSEATKATSPFICLRDLL